MFPANKHPLLVQQMVAMPGTRGLSLNNILKSFTQPHISADSQSNIKAFNYINLDWRPYDKWSHWGDARIQINTYIKNRWVKALMDEKFLHAGYKIQDISGIKQNNFLNIFKNKKSIIIRGGRTRLS